MTLSWAVRTANIICVAAGVCLLSLAVEHRGGRSKGWVVMEPRMLDIGGGQKGYGPMYYGDTNMYGAEVSRNFATPQYPRYQSYTIVNKNPAPSDTESVGARQQLPTPTYEYMRGYMKDFSSYFDAGSDTVVTDPMNAAYWPFQTSDGLLGAGEAGERGKGWREWKKMDAQRSERKKRLGDEMEEYLDDEAKRSYRKDMRFYTQEDWPAARHDDTPLIFSDEDLMPSSISADASAALPDDDVPSSFIGGGDLPQSAVADNLLSNNLQDGDCIRIGRLCVSTKFSDGKGYHGATETKFYDDRRPNVKDEMEPLPEAI